MVSCEQIILNSKFQIMTNISSSFLSNPGLTCWVGPCHLMIDRQVQDIGTSTLLLLVYSIGLDFLKWMGKALNLIYLSMLFLDWNLRSLQNFLGKNINVPEVFQNHQFKRSKSAPTMTTKTCHFLLEGESQINK